MDNKTSLQLYVVPEDRRVSLLSHGGAKNIFCKTSLFVWKCSWDSFSSSLKHLFELAGVVAPCLRMKRSNLLFFPFILCFVVYFVPFLLFRHHAPGFSEHHCPQIWENKQAAIGQKLPYCSAHDNSGLWDCKSKERDVSEPTMCNDLTWVSWFFQIGCF